MMDHGWQIEEDNARLLAQAVELLDSIIGEIVERVGQKRRIRPSMWPDVRTRDHGILSNGNEFEGLRCEELETYVGRLEPTRFIKVIADVVARRMEQNPRVIVLGEDIHRLRGGTNGATRGLIERFADRIIPT